MVLRQAMIAAAVLLALPSLASAAPKHRHHHRHVVVAQAEIVCDRQGCRSNSPAGQAPAAGRRRTLADAGLSHSDPRPAKWCGWALRQWLGVKDRAYNLAKNWAHFGERASGPALGVIAVYPHHVGIVVAVPAPGRMVMKSGND